MRMRHRTFSGQGMTEYLITVVVIAVASIAVFALFGDTLRNQVAGMAMEIAGQNSQAQISAAQSTASSASSAAAQGRGLANYSGQTGSGGGGGGSGSGGQ